MQKWQLEFLHCTNCSAVIVHWGNQWRFFNCHFCINNDSCIEVLIRNCSFFVCFCPFLLHNMQYIRVRGYKFGTFQFEELRRQDKCDISEIFCKCFSSPELKAQVSLSDHLLSAVCPSVIFNFS
jgi:hypothetical protein